MRTGIGYDIHRLIPTLDPTTFRLGGVDVACLFRVDAHSDGDVLIHALVDACLGALALGDIGQWYPDTAAENKKRSSLDFLSGVIQKIETMRWAIHHIDSIVFLEKPKLADYSMAIRQKLTCNLHTELSSISLKAKTMEGIGAIGRGEAVAAQVIATLREI